MTTADLSPDLLAELRRPRAYPAVTVTVPTHRIRQEHQQDLIRLRNTLNEAEKRLSEDPDVSRDDRINTTARLKEAAAGIEPDLFQDGIVVYATRDEHRVYVLQTTVPERVVLSTTYLTRNLVADAARARPYWVVVLSDCETHLWHGSGGEVRELEDGGGFPVLSGVGDRDGPPTREGAAKGLDEDFRRMLQETDERLAPHLAAEPAPVVLAGLRQHVKAYREFTRHAPRLAAVELDVGGLLDISPGQFGRLLEPVRRGLAEEGAAKALAALVDARSGKRFAGGVQEVWRPAREGRAALLVVEQGLRVTARVRGVEGAEEEALEVLEGDAADDAVVAGRAEEDIVDSVVEAVLGTDGEVVFVPDGTLADVGGIAMALRY